MQIIQKIRDKGAAMVIAFIALSLIAFILMDAKQGSNRLFGSGSNSIGKVNGESIDNSDFDDQVKKAQDQYGQQASGSMVYQIRDNVWDQMVSKILLDEEITKLGLAFSPKEMASVMFSNDAPGLLKQAFSDKTTGQYDISKAEEWWSQAKKLKGDKKADIETEVIEPMRLSTLYGKYNAMIAAGAYYPSWLQQKENTDNKTFATISFVSIPYNVISDSTVKVSDDDITDYVKEHAATYKQDGGRLLSYVAFNAAPTSTDTANITKTLEDLKAPFAADTNAKVFVARNLSEIEFNDAYSLNSKITAPQKDSIISLQDGKVFGPYLDGNNIVLAKKIATKQLPDSVKCRHILIATNDPKTGEQTLDDSIAKKRIDSISAAIKGGASFDSLVLQYSDDPGSKNKQGEYTFSLSDFSSLAKEFAETIFYGKTGDKKVIHTSFGWHYIEVLDQKNIQPTYKIAYVAKAIVPSDETVNNANSKATEFSGEAQNDAKSISAFLTKNNLTKVDLPFLIKPNDYQLGALQDARALIRWAFDAKEGDVSEPFSIGDKYVVAIVDKIQAEGLPDAYTARPMVENTIRNLKKADEIQSKLGAAPTLESAASAYNKQIESAGNDSSITFSSQIINGLGQEPKVIGASFNKDYLGKTTAPISGANGVYVLKVNSIGNKPADSPELIAQQKTQREKMLQQEMYGWLDALKKLATIKDDRSKFQ